MSIRRPAVPFASLTPQERAREYEDQADEFGGASPIAASLTSATTAYVRHKLGRRYVGALVIGQTAGGGECRVLPPETVSTAGQDPRVVVGLSFSSAFTGTVNLRVF